MKRIPLLLILATLSGVAAGPLRAGGDLVATYGPEALACYRDGGGEIAALQACHGMVAQACAEAEEGGHTRPVIVRCQQAEARFWQDRMAEEQDGITAVLADIDSHNRARGVERKPLVTAFSEAQHSWEAYLRAECGFHTLLWADGPWGELWAPDCAEKLIFERMVDLAVLKEDLG